MAAEPSESSTDYLARERLLGRNPLGLVGDLEAAGTMRITSKGQVTIPSESREQLGWLPNTEVDFDVDCGAVRIVQVRSKRLRDKGVVARLRGRARAPRTTHENLALTRPVLLSGDLP